jgi:TPR repeat protein
MWIIVALSALFVYHDARTHQIGHTYRNSGFANLSAGAWSACVVLLWIIAFPVYLFKRGSLIAAAKEEPIKAEYPRVAYPVLGVIVALSIGLQISAYHDRPARNYNLALQYLNGQGVAKNDPEAARLFRAAADRGLAVAQNNLGFMYLNGRGVSRDAAQAAFWFQKAADQSEAQAQYNLGNLYFSGTGIEKDVAQAVVLWRKAAEQGLAPAQFNLGHACANGDGVRKDVAQAAFWYRKAADQGFEPAKQQLAASSEIVSAPEQH